MPRHATKPGRVDLGLERGQEPILSKAAVLPVSGMLVVALGAVVHSLIAALVLFPQLILLAQILAATVAGGLALWIMKDDQERAGAASSSTNPPPGPAHAWIKPPRALHRP